MNYDVIVIGAGASGCMAAIQAANRAKSVLLLEHLDKIAKKILSTGNGKCNYTNKAQGTCYYRGTHPAFVVSAMEQFDETKTIDFFREIGIYPKEKNGYVYPYSEQASSMVEVLELALKNSGVRVCLNCEISSVTRQGRFVIDTNQGTFTGQTLIFATGLKAGRKAGCDGSAFQYLEQFGHRFIDVVPALVQMKSKDSFLKKLAGIRAEICLKMLVDGECVFTDKGELLHIEGGLSGIVSFQASRYASYGCLRGQKVIAEIDYFPTGSEKELISEFSNRFYVYGKGKTILEAMVGFFPYKLCLAWLQELSIDHTLPAYRLTDKQLQMLAGMIKHCRVTITGTKGFEDAQVCAGGVDTTQINPETMESKLVPGLFICGELLDIDGMCGGYNLQWAWSSGYVAGTHAG
ncbi:MAG: NAD(P)/FAD-dependent oxidoreductase [Lachnospiraceae bacterium]